MGADQKKTNEKSKLSILTNGLIKENPVLVLVIGTCPTLATSTSVETGFGMGLAATAVLVCSNMAIAALHKLIPDKVRIPCFITVIAGFVTIVQMLLQAFVPSLYSALGLYLPLIVVNCIILGRAEMFASKNNVLDSALDGLGMGLGFTLTLCVMGSIREILGSGTWLAGDWFGLAPGFQGIPILSNFIPGMSIMTMVPGGFFVFACVMAFVHYITRDKSKIRKDFGCSGCVNESACTPEQKAAESRDSGVCSGNSANESLAGGPGNAGLDEKTAAAMKIAKAAEDKIKLEKMDKTEKMQKEAK